MKRLKYIFFSLTLAAIFTSCSISYPVQVTENPVGTKEGTASFSVILGFIRPMDADVGIAAAAKNGKITKVSTVDFKVTGGLFKTTYTTIVTGE